MSSLRAERQAQVDTGLSMWQQLVGGDRHAARDAVAGVGGRRALQEDRSNATPATGANGDAPAPATHFAFSFGFDPP